MFVRLPAAAVRSLLTRLLRAGGRHTPRELLPFGFALAIAASSGLSAAGAGPAYAFDPEGFGPSIQYLEAQSHATQTYSFTPGGVVNVPFRPRAGDASMVDGAAPVALPAAQGSTGLAPALTPSLASPSTVASTLRREVFGFLPYWELNTTLDYTALSTIAYFGIDLNTDGTLDKAGNGWNGWVGTTLTNIINSAHAAGTRMALTVESFAWDSTGAAAQTALLSSPTASLTAAKQIAAEVSRRGADGVNLDFEPIAPGQSANYVAFVRSLRVELDKVHAGYELTFCGTGRPNTYDLPNLLAPGAADAVFIMGYDFRGGSPATTGSIDPLTSPYISFDITDAVNAYLAKVGPSKVILGLPWYGHAWSTGAVNTGNTAPADPNTYGQPAAVYYSTAAGLDAITDSTHLGKLYDAVEQTGWTAYYGSYGGLPTWRELYYDNARALGAKLDAIDGWNLRGPGIWALGYDNNNGNGDLTATIASKLQAQGTTYHAIPPARILDTRNGTGLSGGFTSRSARTFQVAGVGGVLAGATAVTGNLTVTGQTYLGYLYVGPVPMNNPTSSTLNFPKGDDRANAVTVALGTGGTLSVTYAAPPAAPGATADVVFDVTGYFTPDMTGATYHALPPTRILDTRNGTGGLAGAFGSHVACAFQVTGAGGVPAGATAVTGNLTVTGQTSVGYLFMGPTPMNWPTSSTLNFPRNDDRANAVTVALGTGGTLSVTYAAPSYGPTAQVIFDVTGYFTPDASGSTYVPLNPARILDSRNGTGGLGGAFSSHQARTFRAAGAGGVPFSATAVTGNLTVTQQNYLGFLFVGPAPQNYPGSSTLNFPKGDDRANAVTVALGSEGTLSVTYAAPAAAPWATAQVIFDVTGYFGSYTTAGVAP
jgi:spore germination protein YaaH